ncbi:MAG: glycosyltransferase family 2 protein [Luteolibacter sp.]|uniref:glycosyltransferase family 2 protein n=1 Tax=Luteolibacter sp. TaxID=1962973 RepID=UPI0032647DC9
MVSVIIPTYNRIGTIRQAVESVLAQTYPDIEIVIADDGSTDGTCESLESYGDKIRIVKQPNRGPSAARNLGVKESSGEILAFLDSDDLWLPEKIERQMEVLEAGGKSVPCCICNATLESEPGKTMTSFEAAEINCKSEAGYILNLSQLLATRFVLFNQVVVVRREVFERIGGFNEDLWLLEDHDLALRLSIQGKWGFVRSPLVCKYESVGNLGGTARKDHARHLEAVVNVLDMFLQNQSLISTSLRKEVEREREELMGAISATRLAGSSARGAAITGKALLFIQRIRRAIRRRSPSWPVACIEPLDSRFTESLPQEPREESVGQAAGLGGGMR